MKNTLTIKECADFIGKSAQAVRIFTIHFATINTIEEMQFLLIKLEFTIHFATINTL